MRQQRENELKLEEVKGHLRLAKIFFRAAGKHKEGRDEGECRLAVDVGYNSVEHCLKAFILLKSDTIPRRHSGIAQRFSELYIKEKEFKTLLSKKVRLCLKFRNLARYDPKASVGKIMIEETLSLAKELIRLLERKTSQVCLTKDYLPAVALALPKPSAKRRLAKAGRIE